MFSLGTCQAFFKVEMGLLAVSSLTHIRPLVDPDSPLVDPDSPLSDPDSPLVGTSLRRFFEKSTRGRLILSNSSNVSTSVQLVQTPRTLYTWCPPAGPGQRPLAPTLDPLDGVSVVFLFHREF